MTLDLKRAGLLFTFFLLAASMSCYLLRDIFGFAWLGSLDGQVCFLTIVLMGMTCLVVQIWKLVRVEPSTPLKVALALGAAPLVAEGFILVAWLRSNLPRPNQAGMVFALAALVTGVACLLLHVAACREWAKLHGRNTAVATLLLLASFLVALRILVTTAEPVGHITIR